MDTDREKKGRRKEGGVASPTGGGEAKKPENMEDLYAYVWSWGTKEEGKYLSHPRRDLITTGTMITPPHYHPSLQLCFWRWKASKITV